MKYAIAASALLTGAVSARQCQNLTVPVHIEARNGVFDYPTPENNIDVTNFILDLTQQGKNVTERALQRYETVTADINVGATYCQPDSGKAQAVQVLTHGIGFDRSYWDVPFNNYNYSYVAEAVDHYGYATFSYDRPGIGESGPLAPIEQVQALFEVDALRDLTEQLRAGKIASVPQYESVVHVGHSFGSQHTYALTAMYPDISDCIALTGFSQNPNYVPYFALGGNFIEANQLAGLERYPQGYIAPGNPTGVQTNFFSPGSFDAQILEFAASTGQPVTVGELLTIGGEAATNNTFAGPALIITGERDVPYCGGNCLNAPEGFENIPMQSDQYFLNTKPEISIVPGAGHGLNLEYSHPLTYKTINDFFAQKCGGSMMAGGKPYDGAQSCADGDMSDDNEDGGAPVTQIADGQVQAPTGKPVTQIADGQIQAPTGKPVTQVADGQIQAPTGKPVTQIADGQIQAPTGKPVTQIADGQVQAPKAYGEEQGKACNSCKAKRGEAKAWSG